MNFVVTMYSDGIDFRKCPTAIRVHDFQGNTQHVLTRNIKKQNKEHKHKKLIHGTIVRFGGTIVKTILLLLSPAYTLCGMVSGAMYVPFECNLIAVRHSSPVFENQFHLFS